MQYDSDEEVYRGLLDNGDEITVKGPRYSELYCVGVPESDLNSPQFWIAFVDMDDVYIEKKARSSGSAS